MAKSGNQKLKILYLAKLFYEKTDENNKITTTDIIEYLNSNGIGAERKSIYADIEALQIFGFDIIKEKTGMTTAYYLASRNFEVAELKLLVDSIQASKFITTKKSIQLIKKIESLASVYQAQHLQRQVVVSDRVKNMNESIYYSVDKIHTAINDNKQISFKYFEYSITKEKVFRRGGEKYIASPFALNWDDENYYLIAYDALEGIIKHYRVDKMTDITVLDDARCGEKLFASSDIPAYSRKIFSMFNGEERMLKLEFDNSLIGVIIDRFGKDIAVIKSGENRFCINISLVISPLFFGWMASFGGKAKIIGPADIREKYIGHIKKILEEQI